MVNLLSEQWCPFERGKKSKVRTAPLYSQQNATEKTGSVI